MLQVYEFLKWLLVRALPTFFLFILLHWYFKKVLFQPLVRVIGERREKTEGVIAATEAALAALEQKIAAYDESLADATSAIYRDQETARNRLVQQQTEAVQSAKAAAAQQVAAAKADLAVELAQATASLAAESDHLAEQIAGVVLSGKAH